ncbi:hypothetical protein EV193_10371 [Herbihabitans rhizosphaerae]|uniref:Uncharacterized protein n=1 Tax=Herbihabitans rhizosphaerae TaxID=1872711 RepID=A0A4Q7KUT1_9PSEU|nr:hypothetical protein [Herbihabitans rhizosphaerae]RZS40758.1 hypothetical protein EV193_10371 [Herbihabitans rhizosphaerae]
MKLLVLVVPLLLAGCGGEEEPAAQPPPGAPGTVTTTTVPPPPPVATTTTTTTTTSETVPTSTPDAPPPRPPEQPPTRNVRDCVDGYCTITLSRPAAIPLDKNLYGVPNFTVKSISPGGIEYTMFFDGMGTVGGGIGPGASSKISYREVTKLHIVLLSVAGRTATIAFIPGTP